MNSMYQQPYGWGYDPMMLQAQQQKLAELEQQYPQFAQQSNFQPNGVQNYMKCRAVTSVDEAKASIIDLDGSIHVFTDIGNKKIYTKQINLDGTASLKTYTLQEELPQTGSIPQSESSSENYVKKEELETICRSFAEQISDLREELEFCESLLEEKTTPTPKQKGGRK